MRFTIPSEHGRRNEIKKTLRVLLVRIALDVEVYIESESGSSLHSYPSRPTCNKAESGHGSPDWLSNTQVKEEKYEWSGVMGREMCVVYMCESSLRRRRREIYI